MQENYLYALLVIRLVMYGYVACRAWTLRNKHVVVVDWHWLGAVGASAIFTSTVSVVWGGLAHAIVAYTFALSVFMLAFTARGGDAIVEKKR